MIPIKSDLFTKNKLKKQNKLNKDYSGKVLLYLYVKIKRQQQYLQQYSL